ncbi:MAG: metalloregulator ArsR/SmtB family transcription factor [Neptuniibacter sp.]
MLDLSIASQGFAAAGSESRLSVLRVLIRAGYSGLTVSEIQQRLEIPASTLAHHLKFLTAGELIIQEKHGRSVVNRANYEHIKALADFLLFECCIDSEEVEKDKA